MISKIKSEEGLLRFELTIPLLQLTLLFFLSFSGTINFVYRNSLFPSQTSRFPGRGEGIKFHFRAWDSPFPQKNVGGGDRCSKCQAFHTQYTVNTGTVHASSTNVANPAPLFVLSIPETVDYVRAVTKRRSIAERRTGCYENRPLDRRV